MVVGNDVNISLRRLARNHRLPILQAPDVASAARAVRLLTPAVVLVHVADRAAVEVDVIRSIAAVSVDIFLITIVPTPQPELEQTVRRAGAHCYLTDADSELLERVLLEVWRHEERDRMDFSHGA